MEVRGSFSLEADWGGESSGEVRLGLSGVGVAEPRARFSVGELEGEMRWSPGAQGAGSSELRWEGATLLRAVLGAGSLSGVLAGRRFTLSAPAEVGFLDGTLLVTELELDGLGSQAPAFSVGGALGGVSMEAVSEVLGWPSFPGSIAGDIPPVRYAEGVLRVEGDVVVQALGGRVVVRDLVLERPLGVVPLLRADVDLEALSLEAVTSAFSFGRITGHVDGRIRDLELVDWRPAAFDASFRSVPEEEGPRRISQRAVDNLAALGGGPSALLSSTFLRFFAEFSYAQLGLRCRLHRGVCEMGGIEDAEGGYRIVEGSGIPRITVRGFNRRVDWNVLVERLEAAIASEGPTIR
jgi:hypothetical protein